MDVKRVDVIKIRILLVILVLLLNMDEPICVPVFGSFKQEMVRVLDFEVVAGLKRVNHSIDTIRVAECPILLISQGQEAQSFTVQNNKIIL